MAAWRLWGISGLILLCVVSWGWAHEGVRLAPAKMVRQRIEGRAPDLVLVNQSGQPMTLMELRGKVVLLTFTYSTCAEVCPLITAAMVTLQQRLTAAERQQVFFLSVTAQPEVDTPAVLYAYANRLGVDLTSWAFVTGPPQAVQAVWQAFGLTVKRRAKGVVDHPAWTFLIDREGMVRYRYLGSLLEVENMLEDMRTLW
jgi:protein SCO1